MSSKLKSDLSPKTALAAPVSRISSGLAVAVFTELARVVDFAAPHIFVADAQDPTVADTEAEQIRSSRRRAQAGENGRISPREHEQRASSLKQDIFIGREPPCITKWRSSAHHAMNEPKNIRSAANPTLSGGCRACHSPRRLSWHNAGNAR